MPLPNLTRPFAWFWNQDQQPEPPPPPPPQPKMTWADRQDKERSDYLVSISRGTKRGQEFAKMADEARAMVREMGATKDWKRRHAIVQALKSQGWIDD